MQKTSISWPWFSFLLLTLTLLGCGKGFDKEEEQQEEVAEGQYKAVLRPLNSRLGRYSGMATFSLYENQFWARVKVYGGREKVVHAQHVHVRGPCPTSKDDANQDGYIDYDEVENKNGKVLIPLDSNLNSQIIGMHDWPQMRKNGYYYSEACHIDRLMEDLRNEDVIIDDMMAKLPRSEDLDLTRRVVIIYGVHEDQRLPSSVRTFEPFPSTFTIPIACGEIEFGGYDGFVD